MAFLKIALTYFFFNWQIPWSTAKRTAGLEVERQCRDWLHAEAYLVPLLQGLNLLGMLVHEGEYLPGRGRWGAQIGAFLFICDRLGAEGCASVPPPTQYWTKASQLQHPRPPRLRRGCSHEPLGVMHRGEGGDLSLVVDRKERWKRGNRRTFVKQKPEG